MAGSSPAKTAENEGIFVVYRPESALKILTGQPCAFAGMTIKKA
jgi:hypothetical protein